MALIKINAVIEHSNRYLLVKRCPEDGGYWQTVTGGVEPNENLLYAVRREVQEETGLTDLSIDENPIHYFTWQKNDNDLIEIAYLCHTTQDTVHLSIEHTEFTWADKQEAEAIVEKPNNKVVIQKANLLGKSAEPTLKRPDISIKLIVRCGDEAFMLFHPSSGHHDFPGGRMEWGESFDETLKRELKEELDYDITKEPKFIYVWNYVAEDKSRHTVHIYYLLTVAEKPHPVSSEGAELHWLPKDYFYKKDEELANKIFGD